MTMTLRFLALSLAATLTSAFNMRLSTFKSTTSSSRHAVATMKETDARRAWLAKLDVPSFGKERAQATEKMTTETIAKPEPVAVLPERDENVAKIAWLSKLDQPKLGVLSEAAAKASWLNKLDLERSKWATVGKVVATEPKEELVSVSAEDAAKQRWLASIEK